MSDDGDAADAGLCGWCRWSRTVPNRRGSVFRLCGRSETDPAYPKYPWLPVRACRGHEERDGSAESEPHR